MYDTKYHRLIKFRRKDNERHIKLDEQETRCELIFCKKICSTMNIREKITELGSMVLAFHTITFTAY